MTRSRNLRQIDPMNRPNYGDASVTSPAIHSTRLAIGMWFSIFTASDCGPCCLQSLKSPLMASNIETTAIEAVLRANRRYAPDYDPALLSPRPRLHLAVVTCMDTRLSYRAMGLRPGDAHLIRNAGGIVTADALRSLLVSKYLLGTREIMIINHTDCGLMKATEDEIHRRIEEEAGVPANTPVTFYAFRDVAANVRQQMRDLMAHSWIGDTTIRGFVFHVEDGHLREVQL